MDHFYFCQIVRTLAELKFGKIPKYIDRENVWRLATWGHERGIITDGELYGLNTVSLHFWTFKDFEQTWFRTNPK